MLPEVQFSLDHRGSAWGPAGFDLLTCLTVAKFFILSREWKVLPGRLQCVTAAIAESARGDISTAVEQIGEQSRAGRAR